MKKDNKKTYDKNQKEKNQNEKPNSKFTEYPHKDTFPKANEEKVEFNNILHYTHSDMQQIVRLSIVIGFAYKDYLQKQKTCKNKTEWMENLEKLDEILKDKEDLKIFLSSLFYGIGTLEEVRNSKK